MRLIARIRNFPRDILIIALVFAAGLLVTMVVFSRLRELELERLHARLERDTSLPSELLKHKLEEALLITQSLGRFVAASDEMTRARFAAFVKPLMPQDSEIATIAWVPVVPGNYRTEIERQMSIEQHLPAEIFEIGSSKTPVRAKERSVYYPMRLLEVSRPNETRPILGFDMGSTAGRLQTLDRARDSGEVAGSLPIVLAGNGKPGFFAVAPVYKSDLPVSTVAERRAALRGFAMVVFQADRVVHRALGEIGLQGFSFNLIDLDAPENTRTIFRYSSPQFIMPHQLGVNAATLNFTDAYRFGGRQWQMTFSPSDAYIQTNYSLIYWLILPIGVLLSLILATYLRATYTLQSRLKTQVAERTQLLEQETARALENEARYRTLFERAPEALLILDSDTGLWVAANPRASDLTGYPLEVLMTMSPGQLYSGIQPDGHDALESVRLNNERVLAGEELTVERTLIRSDGRAVVCEVRAVRLPDSARHLIRASFIDITQRTQMEAELRASETKFRSVLETISLIGVALDTEGRITLCNEYLLQLTGWTKDEVLYQNWFDLFLPPEIRNEISQLVQLGSSASENLAKYYENEIITRTGERRLIAWSNTLLKDSDGKTTGVASIGADITDRRHAENELIAHRERLEELIAERTQALKAALQQAEAATLAKSMFLSNMSHEIRTPMNAIMGMTHLALKNETSLRQRNYLQKIDNAAQGLLSIINDILDFSKIEAGKLDFEHTSFLLDDVLAHLADLTVINAQEKGLEMLFDIAPDVPTALIGDAMRLRQILLNLVNNAVKFTERGEITLSIRCIERYASNAILQFEIKDTGIGMTTEQSARLFTAFEQADASTTRKFGGTGLGLSISEKLVGMMGGKISVETALGAGSRFVFTVRMDLQPDQQQKRLPATIDMKNLRILVVDDNQRAREIMLSILSSLKLRADAVASANACIHALETAQESDELYNLVLMDWNMPVMNGLDAVRAIRANSRIAQTVTFVMVTAHSRDELLNQAKDLKIEGLLEKPVSPSAMLDAIMTAVGGQDVDLTHSYERQSNSDTMATHLRGAQVLLVEDNDINQELAVDILTGAGVMVDVANNGVEAIAMVDKKRYDVVLMDCQMPVMDGFDATKQIRKDTRFASLPILAMSANAMAGDKEECLAVGMNDHIAKPIDIDKLFAMLARWITSRDLRNGLAQQIPRAAIEDGVPHLPGVDMEAALKRLRGNTTQYRKLLLMFHERQADVLERIQNAWRKGDRDDAQRTVHTLKSLAGNIGADLLSAAAEKLELAIKQGNDTQYEEMLQQVAIPLRDLIDALRQFLSTPADKA